MTILIDIYRSSKKEGMYLYVNKGKDVKELPANLLAVFGKPAFAMLLPLSPERKLANADTERVLQGISEKGFYLQMPPASNYSNQTIVNDKLPR